ncbi:MAG TPA: HipA family kinase [Dehalococcoidia bacterium]|nr:HipA family kinase [Dehalococcoidia bacterium]
MIPRYRGVRYVLPLREGGSLPAVVDTDRGGPFVVKFRGAGQGAKALIAEALAAAIAVTLELPVPQPAIVHLADGFGRGEPDPEIQDILRGSAGSNFGLAYLPGAVTFDGAVDGEALSPDLAAEIVWLDAFLMNVDRTVRNPNLLIWRDRVWLIDHGAALYVHHRWAGWEERVQSPFPQIRDHVLLARAGDLTAADTRLRPRLTEDAVRRIVADLPDEWLGEEPEFAHRAVHREAYVAYLLMRLDGPRRWLEEAREAHRRGPARLAPRETHRVV